MFDIPLLLLLWIEFSKYQKLSLGHCWEYKSNCIRSWLQNKPLLNPNYMSAKFKKSIFLNKEMVFKQWVEKIKTVGLNILPGNCKTSFRKRSEHFRGSTWYSTLFSGCHCHNTLIICWCKSGVFAPQKCTPWLDFLFFFWHFFSFNLESLMNEKKHILKSVHFKKTVARFSFLSKLWSFSIQHQLKSKQS